MDDKNKPSCSKPLHVQRVERALDLNLFLNERRNEKLDSSDEDDENNLENKPFNAQQELEFLNGNT